MLAANDGGGGGNSYAGHTQRELLAAIASVNSWSVDAAETTWRDTASRLREIHDLIDDRLTALLGEDGWTGEGADVFRKVITHDLLKLTNDFATTAEANATALEPVNKAVSRSVVTAMMNDIPWDNDTQWRVDRERQDQTLFGKVDEVVTGDDDDLEKREANAPYLVLDGTNGERARRTKPDWEALQSSIPTVPAPPIFGETQTPVSPETHRFDRVMEALDLNRQPRHNTLAGATAVNTALEGFSPRVPEPLQFTQNDVTGGGGRVGNGVDPEVLRRIGAPAESDPYSEGGAGPRVPDPTPHPGPTPDPGPHTDGPGGPGAGGPGAGGPGAGGPGTGGPGIDGPRIDGPGPRPGWDDDLSKLPVDEPGTRAAGVDAPTRPTLTPSGPPAGPSNAPYQGPSPTITPGGSAPQSQARPLGAPTASPVGQPGARSAAGPGTTGRPSIGPGATAGQGNRPVPGAGTKVGHGQLGGQRAGGASGPFAGRSGSSFSMGPNGRGIVNPGNVGAMAGAPGGAGSRGNRRDEEGRQGYQSWLEEDTDVWLDNQSGHAGDI